MMATLVIMAMGFPGQCYLMIDGPGGENLQQTLHNTQPILGILFIVMMTKRINVMMKSVHKSKYLFSFLAPQDALEVMGVTHSLKYLFIRCQIGCGVNLVPVSNWSRCQIDSLALLVSNWSGVKFVPLSN